LENVFLSFTLVIRDFKKSLFSYFNNNMGSFANLEIGGRSLFESKNSFFYDIVEILFSEQDIEKKIDDVDGYYSFYGFEQRINNCLDRLGVIGVNESKAEDAFNKAKSELLQDGRNKHFDISYGEYKDAIYQIVTTDYEGDGSMGLNLLDDLTNDLLLEGMDLASNLFTILSVFKSEEYIVYDLTAVVNGGWVTETDVLSSMPEKILVLTEGKTDTEFIKYALDIRYPHLKDHYQFLDFEQYNPEANASYLAKFVTSLAAANFKHPIIAIFDNDTTGISEMVRLKKIRLGERMRVLKYPDLEIAKNYPALGPSGIQEMDINGLACSIELYFGEEILKRNGEFVPITWKAYNDREKKYQGEIQEKGEVQNRFRDRAREGYHCGDMELILTTIFKAYH